MGRRSGFGGFINAMAREAARTQRVAAADQRRRERDYARAVRERERAVRDAHRRAVQAEKEARRAYLEERAEYVDQLNAELEARVEELLGVLDHTLSVDDAIDFGSLRLPEDFPAFAPPPELARASRAPSEGEYLSVLMKAPWYWFILPWLKRRYERRMAERMELARAQFAAAAAEHVRSERDRLEKVAQAQRTHEESRARHLTKVRQRNGEVDELERAYLAGEQDAVETYNSMVLERSQYPDGFPQEFRLAYVPASRELVLEYQMPEREVVPQVSEHKCV